MASYDIIGNIAIMKFRKEKKAGKLKLAKSLLKRKNIKTVVEKVEKVKGRLRTIKTRFLAGEKTKETVHKENNCLFKLDVDGCYFSPRLSEERKELASKIRKKDNVLVMFSGVGPYAIVIGKRAKEVTAIELSRVCNKYAKNNVKLNKLTNVELIQGDVKKKIPRKKFDVIVMPRPNLRDTFLKSAFAVSKKGTIIYYYGFSKKEKMGKMMEEIYKESKKVRKKIKILRVKKAGDIAPYAFRYRVEIKVL
jgi:tRNA (guanine37-N1)-methyltransferase